MNTAHRRPAKSMVQLPLSSTVRSRRMLQSRTPLLRSDHEKPLQCR